MEKREYDIVAVIREAVSKGYEPSIIVGCLSNEIRSRFCDMGLKDKYLTQAEILELAARKVADFE